MPVINIARNLRNDIVLLVLCSIVPHVIFESGSVGGKGVGNDGGGWKKVKREVCEKSVKLKSVKSFC